DAAAELENSAAGVAWSRIGAAIDLQKTLLVKGYTASHGQVRRKTALRSKLHPYTRCDVYRSYIPSRSWIGRSHDSLRIPEEVNFSEELGAAIDQLLTVVGLQSGSTSQPDRVGAYSTILGQQAPDGQSDFMVFGKRRQGSAQKNQDE